MIDDILDALDGIPKWCWFVIIAIIILFIILASFILGILDWVNSWFQIK